MFCSTCGTSNEAAAKFCHSCGAALGVPTVPPIPPDPGTMRGAPQQARVIARPAPTGKNPTLAAIMSALIVGVGQFYNGDFKKGAIMLLGAAVLGVATGGVLWLGLAIWSAIDAYQVANGTGKMW